MPSEHDVLLNLGLQRHMASRATPRLNLASRELAAGI